MEIVELNLLYILMKAYRDKQTYGAFVPTMEQIPTIEYAAHMEWMKKVKDDDEQSRTRTDKGHTWVDEKFGDSTVQDKLNWMMEELMSNKQRMEKLVEENS